MEFGSIPQASPSMPQRQQSPGRPLSTKWVQMVLWTAGVVVLTLVCNAPLIPPLLAYTGLTDVPPVKMRMRSKAARSLLRFTQHALQDLRQEEDEMLRGVTPARSSTHIAQKPRSILRNNEGAMCVTVHPSPSILSRHS